MAVAREITAGEAIAALETLMKFESPEVTRWKPEIRAAIREIRKGDIMGQMWNDMTVIPQLGIPLMIVVETTRCASGEPIREYLYPVYRIQSPNTPGLVFLKVDHNRSGFSEILPSDDEPHPEIKYIGWRSLF